MTGARADFRGATPVAFNEWIGEQEYASTLIDLLY